MSMSSKSMLSKPSSIPSSTNNNDDEVAAIIQDAHQRAHATFESSDCRSNDAAVIDPSDIEKCLAEVYHAHAASRSSREAPPPPPSSSKEDYLLRQQPSSCPPGSSERVHIDWSEHYYDDRQGGRAATGDEMIIDVDRFASRHGKRGRWRREDRDDRKVFEQNAMALNQASTNPRTIRLEESDHSSPHSAIYVSSNHSPLSISTLGTMGFKEIGVKKTVDPFTAPEHPTNQHSRVLLDHGAISSEERSARSAKKPPTPPPPPPPLAQPLKRQTSTPLTDQTTHRLGSSSSSSSSSSAKHPGEGRPAVTHDSQREELSWHDRKAFKHNLKALKQVPPPPPPSLKLPLTRRASAPIEWQQQQQQQQRSTSTRTKNKLSPIPQSPYVVEGESTPSDSCRRAVSSPKPPPLSSSPPAPQMLSDIDIHLTAKSSEKTRVHTGLMPPLPIKAPPPRHHATTNASCRAVSSSEENKHGSLETNLRKNTTVNGNLGKSWPVGGRSHQEQQHQLMNDDDEINLSRVAIRQDTVDYYENFSKSWPAGGGGGRSPTGDRSQQWQYQKKKKKKKKDDELLNKVKVGYYQHDREKECPPPPPPPHHAQSPHSVTCAISSPVVSPTDSEVAAKRQSKNTNHPSRDGGGSSKNIRQDKMKLPPLPFSSNARPIQISNSTMQTQKTQRDFNITLMKLQHQVELSKRTNGLAARQYHARHFWFYPCPYPHAS